MKILAEAFVTVCMPRKTFLSKTEQFRWGIPQKVSVIEKTDFQNSDISYSIPNFLHVQEKLHSTTEEISWGMHQKVSVDEKRDFPTWGY